MENTSEDFQTGVSQHKPPQNCWDHQKQSLSAGKREEPVQNRTTTKYNVVFKAGKKALGRMCQSSLRFVVNPSL